MARRPDPQVAIRTEDVLAKLDGLAFIRMVSSLTDGPDVKGEVKFLCPFHGDTAPSASFNVDSKLFVCYACGAKGSAVDLLAKVSNQPRHVVVESLARELDVSGAAAVRPALVEEWTAGLKLNAGVQRELLAKKGLGLDAITRWRLGWDAKLQRLTIPIRDRTGTVVNVRLYDLLKVHDPKNKMVNVKGHGGLRLFPLEALDQPAVILTEGELKMIGLQQRGFNAITATGGASGWMDKWNHDFAGKLVAICYDVDEPGVARARALARRLKPHAAEVQLVELPLDRTAHPHGDVLDYFLKEGYVAADFANLVKGTPVFDPGKASVGLRDDLVYDVELSSASKAQYFLRKIRADVVVSAKDTAPYIVPRDVRVSCGRDQECCASCPVFATREDEVWTIDPDEPGILQLIDVNTARQLEALRVLLGIPIKCKAHQFIVDDSHNLEEVRLIPQLSTSVNHAAEQTVARAYHVGHGVETNASYTIEGRVAVRPQTQHATILIAKLEANTDNLSTFKPTAEELATLLAFRPVAWTKEAIDAKLNEVHADLEANVTRTWERRDLHVLLDLAWHSPLYVTLCRTTVKGWVDVAVVGDSGQAKSETSKRLLDHYGLGERADLKGASTAGLKGGLVDDHGRWFVTWGVIPLNDRRLVLLEEVKGCPPEVLQGLTDMRSSGVAELTKIERRRTNARTRLVWISNPRSDRPVSTYNFGVETIKELFGSLEDTRRLDCALVVASGEVNLSVINRAQADRPLVPHVFTAELCQRLVLWAWSRDVSEVRFTDAAEALVLEKATWFAGEYSAAIPLVEPADQRYKLARLAAALAARTFSADADGRLVVERAHVEWLVEWLDRVYSSVTMGYRGFSDQQNQDVTLIHPDTLRTALGKLPQASDAVRGMLRTNGLQLEDLVDFTGEDKDVCRDLLSLLVRRNALKRKGNAYYKTPTFITFLKGLEVNGALHAPAAVEPADDY